MSKQMGEMRLKLTNRLNIRYMVTSLISLYRWDEIDARHITYPYQAPQTLQASPKKITKRKKAQTIVGAQK